MLIIIVEVFIMLLLIWIVTIVIMIVSIGLAAIGQVHRATLKRDGTPVVVKVRYPNVEWILRGDFRTIKMFAQIAQPVHVPAIEQIEKQLTEFDYVQEAEQLDQVKANLSKAGLEGPGKMCRIPKLYMEFCTMCVLVMEELHGVKLADGLKQEMKERAKVEGKTVKQYMTKVKQKETEAKEKGEELKGPTNNEYEMYIGILDSKRKLTNAMHRAYNWTVGLLPGKQKKIIQDKLNLPINHAVRNYLYCVCVFLYVLLCFLFVVIWSKIQGCY
jgi:hypothetical protein